MGNAPPNPAEIERRIADLYEGESRRVFATLVRLLGDFDLAEDAMHEAFASAVTKWPVEGIPANPRAWLVSAGRFKAIDAMRRRARFDAHMEELSHRFEPRQPAVDDLDEARFNDDQLRLIFTCCHPALSPDVQVALTLREVCGLRTEEVASAFLTTAPTIAQRIVRGKAKIRDTNIPFVVPPIEELPDRLDSVLAVVYLVFNEGYSASSGEAVVRGELSGEAIRLGRLLVDLLPDAEAMGLLALMLLHESRRTARMDAAGDLVLLEDQDRTKWNQTLIREGRAWVARAMATGPIGTYTLQAAISAVHAVAATPDATDWNQIVGLYDLLLRASPTPIVELNRAVAVAMRDGYEAGVAAIDAIFARGELAGYHLAHAARGDLCRRMGRVAEARSGFQRAFDLAQQEPERRFLARRLAELADEDADASS